MKTWCISIVKTTYLSLVWRAIYFNWHRTVSFYIPNPNNILTKHQPIPAYDVWVKNCDRMIIKMFLIASWQLLPLKHVWYRKMLPIYRVRYRTEGVYPTSLTPLYTEYFGTSLRYSMLISVCWWWNSTASFVMSYHKALVGGRNIKHAQHRQSICI